MHYKENKITNAGKIKINNGAQSKYIQPEELVDYEVQGWVKGGLSRKHDT